MSFVSIEKYQEALDYQTQALTLRKKFYTRDHEKMAESLLSMGYILTQLRRFQESVD
mgnify:CR=1 FL=1